MATVVPTTGVLQPLGLDEVTITGGFWGDRQSVNATASIPHCLTWEERLGWVGNFGAAAMGTLPAERTGREFADSDVYKLVEAMAWETARSGDSSLDAQVARLSALIGAAQQEDGYLDTAFGHPGMPERYSDLAWGHELYCYGHLLQAAVARIRTGHDDELVAVARRAADHVCDQFGPSGREAVCGHPEIETALVELYRATGERRYLDVATLFVERRGRGLLPEIGYGPEYFQDDGPVRDATTLRGHAVRALYLAAGAIDVAVETGDTDLLDAVRRQYDHTLATRTYITGGMGSHHLDESFGDDFELPPDRAYSETCAGVASVMVAWRLLLATGEMAYADVIERTLYNVVATSPSADGRAFFYTNPLQKRVAGLEASADRVSPRALAQLRAPWFEVSCCPTNVARTLASLAGLVATKTPQGIQLHQYASCRIATTLGTDDVELDVQTGYPARGDITVTVVRAPDSAWQLDLRVPGWAQGSARLDGVATSGPVATVRRRFTPGDIVHLQVPVAPRFTAPDPRIDAVRGCVAVEAGPRVLCVESVDLPEGFDLESVSVDPGRPIVFDENGTHVAARVVRSRRSDWPYADHASAEGRPAGPFVDDPLTELRVPLVAYHSWGNRGPGTMRVWLPATVSPAVSAPPG